MGAKLSKISELSKLLAEKDTIGSNLLQLFSEFRLSSILSRLSLEKQKGVSGLTLIPFLCMFCIMGDSVWKAYKARFYGLMTGEVGKNCFYRMLGNCRMDWRRLLCAVCKRYLKIVEEKGEKRGCGLTSKEQKNLYRKKRAQGTPGYKRVKEADMRKTDGALAMIRRAYKNGIRAAYALMDSWYSSESMLAGIRAIGKGYWKW